VLADADIDRAAHGIASAAFPTPVSLYLGGTVYASAVYDSSYRSHHFCSIVGAVQHSAPAVGQMQSSVQ